MRLILLVVCLFLVGCGDGMRFPDALHFDAAVDAATDLELAPALDLAPDGLPPGSPCSPTGTFLDTQCAPPSGIDGATDLNGFCARGSHCDPPVRMYVCAQSYILSDGGTRLCVTCDLDAGFSCSTID